MCVIDTAPGRHYVGDIADKAVPEDFARRVIEKHGRVDVLVNNAPPQMHGIDGGQTRLMIYHGDCGWTLEP